MHIPDSPRDGLDAGLASMRSRIAALEARAASAASFLATADDATASVNPSADGKSVEVPARGRAEGRGGGEGAEGHGGRDPLPGRRFTGGPALLNHKTAALLCILSLMANFLRHTSS